jgi:hypothetical protein
MLSIRRCRELIGRGCQLIDSELEVLRDQMYVVANIAISEFEQTANQRADVKNTAEKSSVRSVESALELVPELEKVEIEEESPLMELEEQLAKMRVRHRHGRFLVGARGSFGIRRKPFER